MPDQFKDYNCTDMVVQLGGKRALQVSLKTKEFGVLRSKPVVKELVDGKSDNILWDSLANELIDEYEDRLRLLRSK